MNKWQMLGVVMVIAIFVMVGLIAFKYITGDYQCVIHWENKTNEQVSCFELNCTEIGCVKCHYSGVRFICDCTIDEPLPDGRCFYG